MTRKWIALCVLLVVLLCGCSAGRWGGYYGVAAWTNRNMATLEEKYEKASEDEKAFFRAYVNPPINVMHQACLAVAAIEEGDDVALAHYIYVITRIATETGKNYAGLLYALKHKRVDMIAEELEATKVRTIGEMGVSPTEPEKKGTIRRALDRVLGR